MLKGKHQIKRYKKSNKEVPASNNEVAAVCSQAIPQTLWHRRLGHPSTQVMSKLVYQFQFVKPAKMGKVVDYLFLYL